MARSLETLVCLGLQFYTDVLLEIANPLFVALQKHSILLLIGSQRGEFRARPALLIVLEVLGHEVRHESPNHVQFVVILVVELLALLGLQEGVIIVLVTLGCNGLLHLLLTQQGHFLEHALLQVSLEAIEGILCLEVVLDVKLPVFLAVDCGVEGLLLVLNKVLALSCFGHGFINYKQK